MNMNIFASFAALLLLLPAGAATGQTPEHKTSGAGTEAMIQALMENPDRSSRHKARDQYRHPLEALSFLGIEPGMTLVEIWPGGQSRFMGRLIQPVVEGTGTGTGTGTGNGNGGGGLYVPVGNGSAFPEPVDNLPYGQVDMVLVFRAHGFMIYDHPAQDYFNEIYRMLKPGGILGIVDHAGDENLPQDPQGENGYVNESHVLMLARRAGFYLLAVSDINRNRRDNKDHPRGVYSLPPSLQGHFLDGESRAEHIAIGESDRFTHKYYKPFRE